MKFSNRQWYMLIAVTLACVFANVPDMVGQGCAMCKTVAASQSKEAAASLNWGILLLLVPPVTIMSSLLLFAFRYRNAPRPSLKNTGRSGGNEDATPTAA